MADNIDISVNVDGDAEAALKKINDRLVAMENSTNKLGSSFGSSFDVFKGTFASGLALGALNKLENAAHELFQTFIVEGIHAAEEQENAINRLNVALAANGKFTKETSEDLIKFAEAIQSTTKFSDEAVIGTEALLQTLTKLDKEGLKKATQAAVDMSAALGIDLDTATRLVGKAANGEVGTFQRYGISIQKGADDAKTFANALDVLNTKFGGAAAGQVNTFSGAVAQLGNIFNDLQEATGSLVIENQTFIFAIKEVSKILVELKKEVLDNSDELKVGLAEAFLVAIDTAAAFSAIMSAVERILRVTIGTFEALGIAIGGFAAAAQQAASGEFSAAMDTIKTSGEDADESLRKGVADPLVFDKASDALGRIKGAAEEGFAAMKDGADGANASIKNATQSLNGLTEEQLKQAEEGKKLAEKLLKEHDLQNEFLKQDLELDLAHKAELLTSEEEFQTAKAALREEFVAKEVEDLQKRNDSLASLGALNNESEIVANNNKINSILAQENAASTKIIDLKAKQAAAEKKIEEEKVKTVSTILGNISSLTQTHNETLFAIGKAAGLAQATIDGAVAFNKALAEGGPFLGPLLAASIAVKTGVQIATIASQHLATGIDSVPGVGTADNFPALLQPGERVVPTETNKDLTRFLEQQNREAALVQAIAGQTAQPQQIVVNIGSEEIVNVVNDSLRSGRALAI